MPIFWVFLLNPVFVDPREYPLEDRDMEKKWGFELRESMERVRRQGVSQLMAGLDILVTPSTIPEFDELREMIEASGGVCIFSVFFCFLFCIGISMADID